VAVWSLVKLFRSAGEELAVTEMSRHSWKIKRNREQKVNAKKTWLTGFWRRTHAACFCAHFRKREKHPCRTTKGPVT